MANQKIKELVLPGSTDIYEVEDTTYTLTKSGSTITLTGSDGSTTSVTDSDSNTTYSAGTGISLSGTTFSNSGVRTVATGSENGTISVNTGGSSANVAVKGLGSAAYTASTAYDAVGAANTALTNAKSYTDTKIADLINSAPSTLDTLGEIATAMEENADVVEALETAIGTKAAAEHIHKVTHTPAGTVSTPTITVTPNTTTVYSITAVGTLPSASLSSGTLPSASLSAGTLPSSSYTAPSLTASCSNRCLALTFGAGSHSFNAGSLPSLTFNAGTFPTLTFNAGTLPTKGSATTVATGIKSATSTQPTFTGTAATLTTTTEE